MTVLVSGKKRIEQGLKSSYLYHYNSLYCLDSFEFQDIYDLLCKRLIPLNSTLINVSSIFRKIFITENKKKNDANVTFVTTKCIQKSTINCFVSCVIIFPLCLQNCSGIRLYSPFHPVLSPNFGVHKV